MNPFKQKQLDEFTITDCEQYIAHYPYGEHVFEVKRKLKQLEEREKGKNIASILLSVRQNAELQEKEKESSTSQIGKTQQMTTNNRKVASSISDDYREIAKNIFMWILIIVAVIIIGTILIIIIEAMFPSMKLNSGIMRYTIYPILLAVGKWIKDQFD